MLTTEEGGPYPATSTGFNPDIIDEQTITYTVEGVSGLVAFLSVVLLALSMIARSVRMEEDAHA